MPTTLNLSPMEGGTLVATAAFTDEDQNPVTPNAGLAWTLKDGRGNVVNSRENVTITPATSVNIVMTGDDLAIGSGGGASTRYLQIIGTYNSTNGSNLNLVSQTSFQITDLI